MNTIKKIGSNKDHLSILVPNFLRVFPFVVLLDRIAITPEIEVITLREQNTRAQKHTHTIPDLCLASQRFLSLSLWDGKAIINADCGNDILLLYRVQ